MAKLNIRNADSPITLYIQHPIPIPAPGEKNKPTMKPLKLTQKEQKKMRKQRRQAELQDKRDRIRMGLIPPDAPKGSSLVHSLTDVVNLCQLFCSSLGQLDEGPDVGRGTRPHPCRGSR